MDYNSVEEILQAGTSNMTVLRNHSKQDDGTDSITGVSWFSFKGNTVNTIYASGNSWIGFGASSEHLRVNRRDGAMYYLYREEGTLYGYYNFLKIRWAGFSAYNYTTDAYAIEYDVILWDTGDISLHMVKIPISSNTGTYQLVASTTYSYTVSTSSPDITFKKTDSGYEVLNSIISLGKPYERRFLLRQGTQLYTVSNDSLVALDSNEISSTNFLNNGIENANGFIPFINNLSNPELLRWVEIDDNASTLIIKATPNLPQVTISNSETIPTDSTINKVEIRSSDDMLYCFSFNDGNNWYYFSGSEWMEATSTDQGMSKKIVNQLNINDWSNIVSSNSYKIRCVFTSLTSKLSGIAVDYS